MRSAALVDGAEAHVVVQPAQVSTSTDLYRRGNAAELPQSQSMRKRTHEDNDCQTGVWPMPKWPAGHVSEAFESVAVKKALILSPPEIYAEIAHHGEQSSCSHGDVGGLQRWRTGLLLCI